MKTPQYANAVHLSGKARNLSFLRSAYLGMTVHLIGLGAYPKLYARSR